MENFVYETDKEEEITPDNYKIDINIKILKTAKVEEFEIEIEGQSVNHVVVNTLRRLVMTVIPIYGFHRSKIWVDHKKSYNMYNNDMIYMQLETLPIPDIPNDFDVSDPSMYLTNEVINNIYVNHYNPDKQINMAPDENKKLKKIEIVLNVVNTTQDYKFVSTHDMILKIDDQISNNYLKHDPISILVLKGGEKLFLRAEAVLGIEDMNGIYEATTTAYHQEINRNKYILKYETLGQLSKEAIFIKACKIMIIKLKKLNIFISDTYAERDISEKIEIELKGEDPTIGVIISDVLQRCANVEKANFNVPHPFVKSVVVSFLLKKKSVLKPIETLIFSIKYIIDLFEVILKKYDTKHD